eukprot:CAMPEP_0201905732 /NCGR_PEP_ID=MMETSP0902-20130614/56659_1 /ASSEMBLY_ACC=CAM_ASM_000551 /TAXON_ID=420261 /ORGANISM="Thalassiosira antarctica, Strain CCMP982" /LENGTH=544 /DNA_ID=CAMNT_0048439851 /DNA_START=70 /DNA_END=1704 /DNA_ORIENTATION=-
MRANIIVCMVVLVRIPSSSSSHHPHPAFINPIFLGKTRPFGKNRVTAGAEDNDATLYDAEEAAVLDAHDVSDPGIEGAAMERAVVMSAEIFKEHQTKIEEEHENAFIEKIKSIFHHDERSTEEDEHDSLEFREAKANCAHHLSDAAAVEHANEIQAEDSEDGNYDDKDLLEVRAAEADFAHDLSDAAAVEHANEILVEDGENGNYVDEDLLLEMRDAEADFAHHLSDAAAVEHANEIQAGDSEDEKYDDTDLLEVRDAEANFAHDLSDVAAVEHANEILVEDGESGNSDDEDLIEVRDTEADFAHHLSDAAAVEHANMVAGYDEESRAGPKRAGEARKVEKDTQAIEHLAKEADKADRSEGHSLERTFSDDNAADLALMMMEQSILAATEKLEICQEKAEHTENKVKCALEEKYSAKALAQSIERNRRAAEMRFLSAEHYASDDTDMSSIIHTDSELLSDALKQEHEAELKLENAIEDDIAMKKELEKMIEKKSFLKQDLHDLENIIHIHEHTALLLKKENAKRSKSKQTKKRHHQFDWWNRLW